MKGEKNNSTWRLVIMDLQVLAVVIGEGMSGAWLTIDRRALNERCELAAPRDRRFDQRLQTPGRTFNNNPGCS